MASSGPPRTLKAEAEAQGAKPKFRSAASCPSMYPASGRSASPPKKETQRSFTNFPGLGEKSQVDKFSNLKEKKEAIPGIYGTTLPISNFSHQESYVYSLETDCSAEKKFHSPEGTPTSTFYKDHYKAAIEQLTALNTSKNSRTTQLNSNSNKQGQFHSWSHLPNQGNTSVSRDFSKPDAELGSGSSDGLINLATTNPPVHFFTKRYHPVSYPETKKTALEKNCRKDDGDSLKKTNEVTTSDSYLATDSSSDDIHSASKWKWKKRNVNAENKHLVEEKEVTESEKRNIALLKYFKNLNVNIKTDSFLDQEDALSLLENDKFPYPDFLPSPYNNLDLKKLSLSKSDSWKSSINPPLNDSLDKIVSRLVEMERLQHLTILREKRREAVSAVSAASNRSISTKELHQSKQPRPLDCLCCLFRPERDVIKCTCQQCHGHKNSATSIRSSSKSS
ncbi:protein FAM217A [Pantherophis guttatus]|uniref:Protein FAM217A n=1 Tax=Pantherophis guttatus TaxID=94885 RepID=A0A6P9CPQ4_PANGU|nr:protein FAM217A [Pantherophis guttatus]